MRRKRECERARNALHTNAHNAQRNSKQTKQLSKIGHIATYYSVMGSSADDLKTENSESGV